ncbi:hypothetical protein NIES2119_24605 [[Phormidium ambiguum] IAM M-71]|uniref:DUF2996 domain-containing protein n=1 Tax=[Phormidium ambiguum] IAM M-71 TaxID=454136 RepID=A0A1U7I910_9CYAN|nr:DUF2996 domain-containing protein [Phormidium ambiguum]OKH32925.1 hypothetical protein NIES2119_24605 [Phormidium ambiguum IAM M-71]
MAEETNQNEAGEAVPSTDSPKTTDIPTANAPDPNAVDDQKAAKKPPAAKKEKAPAVEDKPFAEFIPQHYFPALTAALAKQGVNDLELKLEQQKIPVIGYVTQPECWQVIGSWANGKRQFRVYFLSENIQGQKGFSYSENGGKPSTLEPFLIDERKVTLDLLVFGVVQRLNAQKWLVRN